jgi:hypothetical protein
MGAKTHSDFDGFAMKVVTCRLRAQGLEDASTHSSHRYIVEVSRVAPSAYPQCHWATVEIYLGSG